MKEENMENTNKVHPDYLKVWKANYMGQTPEAKELDTFMKQNYKSHNYIPWATMVRLMIMQDPDADVWVIDDQGSTVHTSRVMNFTRTFKGDTKDTTNIQSESSTEATAMAHFVKIGVRFMGKTMTETYPVQDTKYDAPKIYDANMVNKSIQRAKAKIISTITGLAFLLYEKGDLQFVDDSQVVPEVVATPAKATKTADVKVKPVVKDEPVAKVTPVVEAPVVEAPVVESKFSKDVEDLAKEIVLHKPVNTLAHVNTSFKKQYGVELDVNDSAEVLMAKIALLKDPSLFAKTMRKLMRDKDNVA